MKETTSERLKQIMQDRSLRQVDILEKCKPYSEKYGIKLAKNDLSQYVSGKVVPGQDKLSILAMGLNVDETWLMGYDVPLKGTPSINKENDSAPPLRIPVLGRVAAGVPIDMVEDVVDWEELPADMARHGEYFGLVIHGDSMEPKMSEGDVIIVRQQADIESGQIGIITVNGDDATCKRIMKYADGIMLLSTNPKYPPMQYTSKEMKDLPIRILGKVVELRAKFE